jgi:hypothetical protein
LRSNFPEITIIANKTNVGFSKANNQGIKKAKGEFILLLNSDTLIESNCFIEIKQFCMKHVDVGVVGCKVLNADRTLQYTCFHQPNFISEIIFFTKNIIKNFWDPVTFYRQMKYWNHNDIASVDSVSGCFLWVRKEVFDNVGLLDEKFFMYYEDLEFCKRVRDRSNFLVIYYPNTYIIHLHGKSSSTIKPLIMKECYKSCLYYFSKTFSDKYSSMFDVTCRFVWKLEKNIFSFFCFLPAIKKKVALLKELLKD